MNPNSASATERLQWSDDFRKKLGGLMLAERERIDAQQSDIANLVDKTPAWLHLIETGKRSMRVPDIVRWARAVHLTEERFLNLMRILYR